MVKTEENRLRFLATLKDAYDQGELKSFWNYLDDTVTIGIEELMQRLQLKEPLQYILGYAWFYDRKYKVSPCTLIPRPETEELCHLVLGEIGSNTATRCIDIGTGSGCIPITLALELKKSNWTALDISECALEIARLNSIDKLVNDRIEIVQTDFLKDLPIKTSYDLIISNPPYISRSEANTMEDNVLLWEPEIALFPMQADVLVFYRQLLLLLENQADGCLLFAEINPQYAMEVKTLFSKVGKPKILSDMSGKDRFIEIKKEGH